MARLHLPRWFAPAHLPAWLSPILLAFAACDSRISVAERHASATMGKLFTIEDLQLRVRNSVLLPPIQHAIGGNTRSETIMRHVERMVML